MESMRGEGVVVAAAKVGAKVAAGGGDVAAEARQGGTEGADVLGFVFE